MWPYNSLFLPFDKIYDTAIRLKKNIANKIIAGMKFSGITTVIENITSCFFLLFPFFSLMLIYCLLVFLVNFAPLYVTPT